MTWKHKPGRFQPGNYGSGKMRWFVHDCKNPSWRDDAETGRHRKFSSIEAAQKRADELNADAAHPQATSSYLNKTPRTFEQAVRDSEGKS